MQQAIAAAKSLEEVQQLESLLKAGQLPLQNSGYGSTSGYASSNGQIVEQDMDNY